MSGYLRSADVAPMRRRPRSSSSRRADRPRESTIDRPAPKGRADRERVVGATRWVGLRILARVHRTENAPQTASSGALRPGPRTPVLPGPEKTAELVGFS